MPDTVNKVTMTLVAEKIDDNVFLVSCQFYLDESPNNVVKEKKVTVSKETLNSWINAYTDGKVNMIGAEPE